MLYVVAILFGFPVSIACRKYIEKYVMRYITSQDTDANVPNDNILDNKVGLLPLFGGANTILYMVVIGNKGIGVQSFLMCLIITILLCISVIDWNIYEIPIGLNIAILALSIVYVLCENINWLHSIVGFFSVSSLLYIVYIVSGGRAIGGGDIKLMAVCGFLLGPLYIAIAFFLGCTLGACIHLLRMRFCKQNHELAFGPYLSMGIIIMMVWGKQIVNWYLYYFWN